MLCSFRTWMTCHNWWNHDFCTLSENPEGEYLAVRLWPQAQAHLVMQQDNDPKHTSKSTSELRCCCMTLNSRKPSNVAELKQFCKEEGDKIPPQRCERLDASYRKCVIADVAAKGGKTSYRFTNKLGIYFFTFLVQGRFGQLFPLINEIII